LAMLGMTEKRKTTLKTTPTGRFRDRQALT
jgi:hypothetical protein